MLAWWQQASWCYFNCLVWCNHHSFAAVDVGVGDAATATAALLVVVVVALASGAEGGATLMTCTSRSEEQVAIQPRAAFQRSPSTLP